MKALKPKTIHTAEALLNEVGGFLTELLECFEQYASAMGLHADDTDFKVEHLHGFIGKTAECFSNAISALEKIEAGSIPTKEERAYLQEVLWHIQGMRGRIEEYKNPELIVSMFKVIKDVFPDEEIKERAENYFKSEGEKRGFIARSLEALPNSMAWNEIDIKLLEIETTFKSTRDRFEELLDDVDACGFLKENLALPSELKQHRWLSVRPDPFSPILGCEVGILDTQDSQIKQSMERRLKEYSITTSNKGYFVSDTKVAQKLSQYFVVERDKLLELGIHPLSYKESAWILRTHPLRKSLQPIDQGYGLQ